MGEKSGRAHFDCVLSIVWLSCCVFTVVRLTLGYPLLPCFRRILHKGWPSDANIVPEMGAGKFTCFLYLSPAQCLKSLIPNMPSSQFVVYKFRSTNVARNFGHHMEPKISVTKCYTKVGSTIAGRSFSPQVHRAVLSAFVGRKMVGWGPRGLGCNLWTEAGGPKSSRPKCCPKSVTNMPEIV